MDNAYVTFHHANAKNQDGTPREVYVARPAVFSAYTGADGSTHIVANGGAIIPVKELPEVVFSTLFQTPTRKKAPCLPSKRSKRKTR